MKHALKLLTAACLLLSPFAIAGCRLIEKTINAFRLVPLVLVAWLAGGCLCVVLMTGCAGKNPTFEERQQANTAFLENLREARFKGRAWARGAGSPFGFNAATNWSIGPQQTDYGFEGDVDFTQLPVVEKTP